jgi:hypothetical protein
MERNTFKDGQRVRIIAPTSPDHGELATVYHFDTAPDGTTIWRVVPDDGPVAFLRTHELEAV